MALTQLWKYLNLTRNNFYILFPAKGIVSYRSVISSRFYVRRNRTCSLASQALYNTGNKLNNVNVNCLEILKKRRAPHKTPSRSACSPRVSDLCFTIISVLR